MKSKLLVLFVAALCLLGMTACDFVGIDFGGVTLSIGTTPTEIIYPTITAYPTSTPYPTYTPQPTYTALPTLTAVPTLALPVATETIVYKSITWKELRVFLIQDPTNLNTYDVSTGYMCVEFSTDLVNNLHAAGYDAWIVAITIMRDLVVDGVRSIASSEGLFIQASRLGKQKTLAQIIAVTALLIHYPILGVDAHLVGTTILYIAFVLTIYSGTNYFLKFYRRAGK